MKKIITILDHIVQDKETIYFTQETNFISNQRIYFMVFAKEDQEPFFIQRVYQVAKYSFITGITDHATKKIKVKHTAAHPEPVIIPATKQFEIIYH